MERSEERKKIGSDPGGVSAESNVATAKAATAKEAALDEENEAVIKEKAEETARELSAAAAVDINFVADGTPLKTSRRTATSRRSERRKKRSRLRR